MKRRLAILLIASVAACGGDDPTAPEGFTCEREEVDESRLQAPGTDGVFLGIARIEAGFAGLLYREGALEISVARGHPLDEEAYRDAVRRMIGDEPFFHRDGTPRPVTFRRVDHTWPELVGAYYEVDHCLFALEGVVSTDRDEDRNRVVVGVLDHETADAVRSFTDERFHLELTSQPTFP